MEYLHVLEAAIPKHKQWRPMNSCKAILTMAFGLALGLGTPAYMAEAASSVEVVPRAEVKFIPLNPNREGGPQAGVLWGDIRSDVSSGTIIVFAPNFASPPHIHNVTYRAVVIEGMVHNDDPKAENMWMSPGSFWTQPAGEVHITSVGPEGGVAFLEIQSGPYLVQPSRMNFDNGERPVNVHANNIIWLKPNDVTWIESDHLSAGLEMAFLWGKPKEGRANGTFLKFAEGVSASLKSAASPLKLVLLRGRLTHSAGDLAAASTLETGSYFGSEGEVLHRLTCAPGSECLLYVRAVGKYDVTMVE